jgi:dUTP pyrophosphatase
MTIKFKKLCLTAQLPTRGSEEAAGLDLYYCGRKVRLKAGERRLFTTCIAPKLDKGQVGFIKPRSKLANNHGIDVLAGTIDSDYRDGIGVILLNTDLHNDYIVQPGDRIAQLVVQNVCMEEVEQVFFDVNETERGGAGINSTDERR